MSGITKYLTGVLAFAMALAAGETLGAIIVSRTSALEGPGYGDPMEFWRSGMADFDDLGWMGDLGAGAVPCGIPDEAPTVPPERKDQTPSRDIVGLLAEGASAGAAGSTSSSTSSTQSGGSPTAVLGAVISFVPFSLRTSLPGDPTIFLPTRLPLELLRPA